MEAAPGTHYTQGSLTLRVILGMVKEKHLISGRYQTTSVQNTASHFADHGDSAHY
jgi:hypothetical protein